MTILNTRIQITLDALYKAGFTSEPQMLPALAIGVAESGLVPKQRAWHPESGLRPSSDVLGVPGHMHGAQQEHSDRGRWQISSRWHPEYSDAQCDFVSRAARVLWILSEGATRWDLWHVWPDRAQRHYDEAYNGWPKLRPKVRCYLECKLAEA